MATPLPSDATPSTEQRLDQAWTEYLRRRGAGEWPELEELSGGDPHLLALLRQRSEQAAGVSERTDDSLAPTLLYTPQPSETAAADAGPVEPSQFVVQRESSNAGICSLREMIETVEQGGRYRFGEYELTGVLGRGGMGVVFRAQQLSIQRDVALKMIGTGRFASAYDIERFFAEARAASRVRHAHVVTIYQVGSIDGHHFYSMDFVAGTDLARQIAAGPMAPRRAATYLLKVAETVQAAHAKGVLHRDLKPANVLIDEDDQPHVTDFGLAKVIDQQGDLTATGAAMGTPSYMPPEQAKGKWHRVGPASDVYSLGAILYAMLTGRPPFRGSSAVETMWGVIHLDPPRPRTLVPDCDVDLETICLRCLEKDPKRRYRSAGALADDLRRYLEGEPIAARPASRWRRGLRWCLGVPVIAALTGHRVQDPSRGQRRAQLGLVAALLLLTTAASWQLHLGRSAPPRKLPATVRLAAGADGGMYQRFGRQLAERLEEHLGRPVEVLTTLGSQDNRQRMLEDRADLAILQAAALQGDRGTVIAPLFYEYVHVIVRRDSNLQALADLQGQAICLGHPLSGSRMSAEALLAPLGITPHPEYRDADWTLLTTDPKVAGAIVTLGRNNGRLRQLLASGDYRLLPIREIDALHDRTFEAALLPADVYPRAMDADLPTARTPAFLVCHANSAPRLVQAAIDALYGQLQEEQIGRDEALTWTFLPWHPDAWQRLLEVTR